MGKPWSETAHAACEQSTSSVARERSDSESGATLIEFAIVFPFLILLLVGIVEFSWVFAQYLDVRHGAREGARIAAVNYPEGSDPPLTVRTIPNRDALVVETCSRMNVATSIVVTIDSAGGEQDPITVTAEAPVETLSGLLKWALPSSMSVSSTTVLHAEQPATWENTDPGGQAC